jgi:phospholipase/lecithinase/hemolysin
MIAMRNALRTVAANAGCLFIDLLEQPLPFGYATRNTTLSSSPAQAATTFTVAAPLATRSTYAFPNGERFQIKTITGTGPYTVTADAPIRSAHVTGEAVTQVGDCYLTGNGNAGVPTGYGNSDIYVSADGTHPTDAGKLALGQILSARLIDALGPN